MERAKTWMLAVLVVLSLVQSYMLSYSVPGTAVRTPQNYVNTEQMGPESKTEDVLFPEQMILHFGNGNHTVLNPGDLPFYSLIMSKLKGRQFGGFQRTSAEIVNWLEIRDRNLGIELRLGSGLPVQLLSRMLQLESSDGTFQSDTIDRIWIFRSAGSEEVRTFFFSTDGSAAYEATQADLTVRDVEDDVGLGEYWTPYKPNIYGVYLPQQPVEAAEAETNYQTYSPDLLQRNLFFDPGMTRSRKDRTGSQVYTDGKRTLQVEQDGQWISYTDPAAPLSGAGTGASRTTPAGSISSSVLFVNQHGGWDGLHQLEGMTEPRRPDRTPQPGGSGAANGSSAGADQHFLLFRQYFRFGENRILPIVPSPEFRFGYIQLTVQQGNVTAYERSLITLNGSPTRKAVRWLPGGSSLEAAISGYERRSEIRSLYPVVKAYRADEGSIRFTPVWAVRLKDGTEQTLIGPLAESYDGSDLTRTDLSAAAPTPTPSPTPSPGGSEGLQGPLASGSTADGGAAADPAAGAGKGGSG